MSILRTRSGRWIALAAAFSAVSLATATAHPHVYMWVTVAPHFDEAGRLVAVGQRWSFDLDFSEFAALELITGPDGMVTPPSLEAALHNGVLSWMPDGNYFTRVSLGIATVENEPAQHISARLVRSALVVEFTLPLLEPLAVGDATIGIDVFDPEYFYDIAFATPDIVASDAPAGCSVGRRGVSDTPLDPMAILLLRRLGLLADQTIALDPAAGYPARVVVTCD